MVPSLLIMVREGFEAALIVALVLAYLRRIGRTDMMRATTIGIALAVAISIAVGLVVHLTVGSLEGDARLRAFGAISLAAACVLTWMVFWMRRQSRAIKGQLEHKVDHALDSGRAGRAGPAAVPNIDTAAPIIPMPSTPSWTDPLTSVAATAPT